MLCFDVGKCLGKCVGGHVVSRTINKINGPIINNESNKMLPNINVFGVRSMENTDANSALKTFSKVF